MSPTITGVLIDPTTQSVSYTEITANEDGTVSLMGLYDTLDCSLVDRFSLSSDADLVLDDEGLLKPNNPGFTIGSYPRIFAGKAVLLRVEDHSWVSVPSINMEAMTELVQWFSPADVQEQDMGVRVTTI
jgi:hypothetical protein